MSISLSMSFPKLESFRIGAGTYRNTYILKNDSNHTLGFNSCMSE